MKCLIFLILHFLGSNAGTISEEANNRHNFDEHENLIDFTKLPDNCNATCPALVAKDTSLFDVANGDLMNPDSYGTWVTVASCNNKKYLFSKCGLDWFEAHDMCNTLGMHLVSLKTTEEVTCFASASAGMNGGIWWTSGYDEGCTLRSDKVFSWCIDPQQVFICDKKIAQIHNWHKKEPDNIKDAEKCVNVARIADINYLADKSCNNLYKFVCEEPPCTIDDVICPADPGVDLGLNFATVGTLVTTADYDYLISNSAETWATAYETCKKLNMDLLVVESEALIISMVATASTDFTSGIYYWTSGTNEGCASSSPSSYIWCSSMAAAATFDTSLWSAGQPNFGYGREKCAAMKVTGGTTFDMGDETCLTSYHFICQSTGY